MKQRLRDQIASALAQFVARAMPDRTLKGIAFHPTERTAVVILDDGEFPLLLAPTEAPLS